MLSIKFAALLVVVAVGLSSAITFVVARNSVVLPAPAPTPQCAPAPRAWSAPAPHIPVDRGERF